MGREIGELGFQILEGFKFSKFFILENILIYDIRLMSDNKIKNNTIFNVVIICHKTWIVNRCSNRLNTILI